MADVLQEQCRSALETERNDLLGRLRELDDALSRLANGTYGACEVCKQAIGEDRLCRLPEARQCEDCADARTSVLTASPDVE